MICAWHIWTLVTLHLPLYNKPGINYKTDIMNTKFKATFLLFLFALSFAYTSCNRTSEKRASNSQTSTISLSPKTSFSDDDEVIPRSLISIDPKTHIATYKKNGKRVTGIIELKYWLPIVRDSVLRRTTRKNGIPQVSKDYLSNGHLYGELDWKTRTYKTYGPDGSLYSEITTPKSGGRTERYYSEGQPAKELVYDKNGMKLLEYGFDDNGKKIIPYLDKVKLVDIKTGFYEQNSHWEPMVIMKWKNISDTPITGEIKIKAVFIENGEEEWSTNSSHLHDEYLDAPFRSGISRQVSIHSSVGYQNVAAIRKANVSCQLYFNGHVYKTVKIENKELSSNLIQ